MPDCFPAWYCTPDPAKEEAPPYTLDPPETELFGVWFVEVTWVILRP